MTKDIIQKIESLFWENTFSDVSMDEVALKLGMKKASLYYHFTSKEVMFMEVLNYSYEKYKKYIIALLKKDELEDIISWLINYSVKEKNLYSIISQKWYCKIDVIKNLIEDKNEELWIILKKFFWEKYNLNEQRVLLLRSVIDDLSKKNCIFNCKETDTKKITDEIITLFFNNK